MTVVVLGATGNSGKVVADGLLAAGVAVRAVGRSVERLQGLAAKGAEIAVGDQGDSAFLGRTLRGATSVYALIPNDYQTSHWAVDIARYAEALATALQQNDAPRTVLLSSVGAHQPAGLGPITFLGAAERTLREVQDLDLLILRPGYFFENFYAALGTIAAHGINGGLIRGDLPISMIATADIAAAALAALRNPAPLGGRVQHLLGPRDLTLAEATQLLGTALGRPDLPYIEMPADQMHGALIGSGFSEHSATLYVEMMSGFNAGLAVAETPRTAESTTPTTFESFLPRLVQAFPVRA